MEYSYFDRRKAADELLRGREFTKQLVLILRKSDDVGSDSEDLLSRILNSFSKTISMLNESSSSPPFNASSSDLIKKSEDSGDSSCKSSSTFKDRRGCYKRRRTADSWKIESSTLTDDGHAWRKYGQKVILNAKYPRNYFRCTHKFEHGCQATKQVQRVEEDPPKYSTTYYGHHTCIKAAAANSQIVLLDDDDHCGGGGRGILLNFETKVEQDDIFFASNFPVMKDFMVDNYSSSNHYIVSPEMPVVSDQSEYGGEVDVFSEVMNSVVDFDDDVLRFHF